MTQLIHPGLKKCVVALTLLLGVLISPAYLPSSSSDSKQTSTETRITQPTRHVASYTQLFGYLKFREFLTSFWYAHTVELTLSHQTTALQQTIVQRDAYHTYHELFHALISAALPRSADLIQHG